MHKLFRILIFVGVYSLIAPALSVQEVKAASIDNWNYFKDHPCTEAYLSEWTYGLDILCNMSFGDYSKPMISVPLIFPTYQYPETIFVYSMTGMQFEWAPFQSGYYQNGHLDRFQVSDTEYYADIDIHPYLYQIKQEYVPSKEVPGATNIGESISVSLGELYVLKDYYTTSGTGHKVGIAFGGPENIDKYISMSLPQMTFPPTGPDAEFLRNFISGPHPFFMNNISGSPTSMYPYFDFNEIHGAWVFSTISSAFGEEEWDGNPAFRLNIEYIVEVRAWAEARQHYKWETRMVRPAERGWVCMPDGYWYPPPLGCRTSGGRAGYWSWEVIRAAEYKEGWWAYDINPATDWGGVDEGGYRVPTADSSMNCVNCRKFIRSWMAPDLSRVLPYSPFLVYESRPLPDKPW